MKRIKLCVAVFAMLIAPMVGGISATRSASADGVHTNIVGGTNATQQYGAVSLWNDGRNQCTATLIDRYWALTAAHCDYLLPDPNTEVRASSLNNTSGYEQVDIASYYVNPNYDDNLLKNDVALIKFKQPILHTTPLNMYGGTPAVGTNLKMAGWGWLCEDTSNPMCGHPANILQELNVKTAPASSCPAMWDPANELCIVAASGAHANGCYGDSGGPLVIKSLNEWKLVGITLYDGDDWDTNSGCANNPNGGPGSGVFLNVSKYQPWITQTMIDHS